MVGRGRRGPGLAPALAGLLLAACGAPQYEYVKNSEHKIYFRVPATWKEIDQAALTSALIDEPADSARGRALRELNWLKAYDASPNPDVDHLLGIRTDEPAVLARVMELPERARGAVSLDLLRDIFLPVTETAREQQQRTRIEGFELLRDEVLTPGNGLRGIREVFNYRIGGVTQTFDQTALVNDDASKIYLLVVRCSATCYAERGDELRDVVSSMTVRG